MPEAKKKSTRKRNWEGLEKELLHERLAGNLGDIAKLLEQHGIDLEEVGRIKQINVWQQGYKDEEGIGHVQDLMGIQFSPAWEEEPVFPLIERAAPLKMKPRKTKVNDSGIVTSIWYGDPQIGFWRDLDDGSLYPMHDWAAMDVGLQIGEVLKPDIAVNAGDGVDLPMMSRFSSHATMANTANPAIQDYHTFLALQRNKVVGEGGRLGVIGGNHEARLRNMLAKHMMEAIGLKRATDPPDSWPVMSIPYLCDMDSLGVEYVSAYPAGRFELREDFVGEHGRYSVKSAAAKYASERPGVSVGFGHLHWLHSASTTTDLGGGKKRTAWFFCPGTLARIDGWVPSFHSGVSDRDQLPVRNIEKWTQGVVITQHDVETGGPINVETIPIIDGEAMFRGKRYTAGRFIDDAGRPLAG